MSNIVIILRKKQAASLTFSRACYRVTPGKSVHPLDSTIVLIRIKKAAARQHYSTNPEKKRAYSRQQYSANPAQKRLPHVHTWLSTMIICAQKRAKYVLAEPKPDVKDMYVKEIQSQLLADAEARSLLSDSFPKMHINAKNKVSGTAMCRVAAKKLLNKALQI